MRVFTDEEIKMAEKAEEIQKGHKLSCKEEGDFYAYWDTSINLSGKWEIGITTYEFNEELKPVPIWLPLEHQLWEMVRFERDRYGGQQVVDLELVGSFYAFSCAALHSLNREERFKHKLWQLLLAFVMHELYGKVWDGEEWVKE